MKLGCSILTVGQEGLRWGRRGDGGAMDLRLTFTSLHVHSLPPAPLAALEDEEEKISEYRRLLGTLPTVNRATLKALINHLFRYGTGGRSTA